MKKVLLILFIVMIIPTVMLFTACNDNNNNGIVKPTTETKISQDETSWVNVLYKSASRVELLDNATEQQKANFIEQYTSEELTTEKSFETLVAEYNQSVSEKRYLLNKNHVVYIKVDQDYVSVGMWSVYNNQICIWDATGEYNLYTIVANSNNTGKKGFEREASVDNDCGVKVITYYTFELTIDTSRYRF